MVLRIARVVWLAAAMALLMPGQARADSVRIVDGGPRSKDKLDAVERSLDAATRSLGVCWRGERPDTVTIELTVSPTGQVATAKQVTRGAVAQCVAGVLAVQTLAATGSRYRLRAEFATRSSGNHSIQNALAPHRERLEACHEQAKDRSRGGRVALQFLIRPDGRVIEPKVQSSALADAKVERCLLDRLRGIELGSGLTDKTISYSLELGFSGAAKDASASTTGQAPDSPALQPKKDGPLSGSEITAVMNRRKAEFGKCYEAQARKNRTLAGHVVLRFTIRDDGTVRNVKIRETTLNNAAVERCIIKVGESLRFPAERGRQPTKVWYPFAFSTK